MSTNVFHRYANPTKFSGLATAIIPFAWGLTVLLGGYGLYLGLFDSPADYQQRETVRIMYVHVPAAWMALGCYTTMAIASAVAVIWKHAVADLVAQETAPIGAVFCVLCLITGSLWGEPMWGTWWVWDARLTSMLVLLFLYLGFMALKNAFDDPHRGTQAARLIALVGWINVPIVKFSVDWWNTLHQPASVMRLDGPTIHPEMLTPLLLMGAAYMTLFTALLFTRVRSHIMERRARSIALSLAETQADKPTHTGATET